MWFFLLIFFTGGLVLFGLCGIVSEFGDSGCRLWPGLWEVKRVVAWTGFLVGSSFCPCWDLLVRNGVDSIVPFEVVPLFFCQLVAMIGGC